MAKSIARFGFHVLSGLSDQLHFVYQELESDVVLTARVSEAGGGNDRWQVGLMLPESLDPGSRLAAMVLAEGASRSRFRFVRREVEDRIPRASVGEEGTVADAWVRIARRGNELIGSWSTDGETWEELESVSFDPPFPPALLGGVVATGNDSRPDSGFAPLRASVSSLEVSTGPGPGVGPFLRGDCSGDDGVDISDAACMLNWLFTGAEVPGCVAATNTNGDTRADIADATYLLQHLFSGGPAPASPFPDCGTSVLEADTALGCEVSCR